MRKAALIWRAIPSRPVVVSIKTWDSGYTCEGITIVQPKKKPSGGELTPPEKAANRAISSIRIRIEHAIGGVKRYRMVKDKIRLLKDGIRDTIMETCCGLHNFRLQYRPWHYTN
jgi:hypothetical protein